MPETASPHPQVSPVRRHTASDPCPICGGWQTQPRGQAQRCAGFDSADGKWAYCTREEYAGCLPLDERTQPPTYLHRLEGECRCGHRHVAPVSRDLALPPARYSDRLEACYLYCDAQGRVAYGVDRLYGKGFAQWRPNGRAGRIFGLNGVQPLPYRLPELLAAPGEDVWLAEGEKDADRLRSLGVVATTNSGGAIGWTDAHSEHLRGRGRVVIVEDNDAAGRNRTEAVARSVREVAQVPDIRVLQFLELAEHGDVSDWLDSGHTSEELQQLAESAPRWAPNRGHSAASPVDLSGGPIAAVLPALQVDELETLAISAIPDYPIEILPAPLRELIEANPTLPAALIAGAGIAALAAAVGPNVEIELCPGWRRRGILWCPLIAPRGAGKSPAMKVAFRPLRTHDAEVLPDYQEALRKWRKVPPKERGLRPQDPTILGSDLTLEALGRRLHQSGGAAALEYDELSQLMRGLGEYKRGGGGDRGKFLSLWTGDAWRIQRVTDDLDIYLPRPTVVICGALQTTLHELLGSESDGTRPRWLPHLAGMPGPHFQAQDSAPPASWDALLRELVGWRDRRRVIALTGAARVRFSEHQRRWKVAAQGLQAETVSAALQKADQQALAVLLVLAEADMPGGGNPVGPELVDRAARAVEFCIDSWRALPELGGLALSRKDEILDRGVERLRNFLEQHGGMASRREITRFGVTGARTAKDLDELLRRYEAVYPGSVSEEATGKPGRRPVVVRAPIRRASPRDVPAFEDSAAIVSADKSGDGFLSDRTAGSDLVQPSIEGIVSAPHEADNSTSNNHRADKSRRESTTDHAEEREMAAGRAADRRADVRTGIDASPPAPDDGDPAAGVLGDLRTLGCTVVLSVGDGGQREVIIRGDDIPPTLLERAKRHQPGLFALLEDGKGAP
jgi:hypothetical protein